MDINQFLWKRKQRKINQTRNKTLKAKKVFKKSKEDIHTEVESVLEKDHLFEKKQKFYADLFKTDDIKTEKSNPDLNVRKFREKIKNIQEKNTQENGMNIEENIEIKTEKNNEKNNRNISSKKPLPFLKEMKKMNINNEKEAREKNIRDTNKNYEKKLIKKIFKEKTKTRQPVMKNYINYLLHKIENPKK